MDLAVTEPPSLTEVIGGNLLQTKRAHTHSRTHTTRTRTHTPPMQERARHLWSSQSCCSNARAPERRRSAERRGLSRPPAQDATDGGRADRGRSSKSYRLLRWLNALRFPKKICVNVYARMKHKRVFEKAHRPMMCFSDVQKISSLGKACIIAIDCGAVRVSPSHGAVRVSAAVVGARIAWRAARRVLWRAWRACGQASPTPLFLECRNVDLHGGT